MNKWLQRTVGTVGLAGGVMLMAAGVAHADDAANVAPQLAPTGGLPALGQVLPTDALSGVTGGLGGTTGALNTDSPLGLPNPADVTKSLPTGGLPGGDLLGNVTGVTGGLTGAATAPVNSAASDVVRTGASASSPITSSGAEALPVGNMTSGFTGMAGGATGLVGPMTGGMVKGLGVDGNLPTVRTLPVVGGLPAADQLTRLDSEGVVADLLSVQDVLDQGAPAATEAGLPGLDSVGGLPLVGGVTSLAGPGGPVGDLTGGLPGVGSLTGGLGGLAPGAAPVTDVSAPAASADADAKAKAKTTGGTKAVLDADAKAKPAEAKPVPLPRPVPAAPKGPMDMLPLVGDLSRGELPLFGKSLPFADGIGDIAHTAGGLSGGLPVALPAGLPLGGGHGAGTDAESLGGMPSIDGLVGGGLPLAGDLAGLTAIEDSVLSGDLVGEGVRTAGLDKLNVHGLQADQLTRTFAGEPVVLVVPMP